VFEYAPRAIKMTVVGFGGADKRQVAHMMGALLKVEGTLAHDASDALAVALCHVHSRNAPLAERLAALAAQGSGGRTR